MLTLTRRTDQSILLGPDIEVTVVSVTGGRVRLGIRAPRSIPVHRKELVERVGDENQRALARAVEQGVAAGAQIEFPDGLFGLAQHRAWLLCDVDSGNPIQCLVSCRDPEVQLLVVDAEIAWPDYPVSAAVQAFGGDVDPDGVAVALVVTVPADGKPPVANLMAPLVIDLATRQGRQVVIDRPGLEVSAPIGSVRAPSAAAG